MKTKFVLFIVIPVLLSSCYTTRITPSFLTPENNNQELISRLSLVFDEYSFSSAFAPSEKIYDTEFYEGKLENKREVYLLTENSTAVEIKNLIKKYALNGLSPGNNLVGSIEFQVTFYDFRDKDTFKAISTLSFGIFNLIGLPAGGGKHTLELQAKIFDTSGRLVKNYSGFGTDSYLTGIYYHSANQFRPSLIKCVKCALAEIDQKIYADKANLVPLL